MTACSVAADRTPARADSDDASGRARRGGHARDAARARSRSNTNRVDSPRSAARPAARWSRRLVVVERQRERAVRRSRARRTATARRAARSRDRARGRSPARTARRSSARNGEVLGTEVGLRRVGGGERADRDVAASSSGRQTSAWSRCSPRPGRAGYRRSRSAVVDRTIGPAFADRVRHRQRVAERRTSCQYGPIVGLVAAQPGAHPRVRRPRRCRRSPRRPRRSDALARASR